MRSFLGFLILVVLLVGVLAFAVLPVAGPGLVSAVIRGMPPLAGQNVTVSTQIEAAGLLRGEIGRIDVAGPRIEMDSVSANVVTVSVDALSIVDRSFGNLDARATSVSINQPDGSFVELDDGRMFGSSETLDAVGQIPVDEVIRLLTLRLAVAGMPVDAIRLEPGVIVVTIAGQEIESRLSNSSDSVVLTPAGGLPPVTVSSGVVEPWRLIGLDVAPAGITVQARLMGARLG
jgi:hypothetical protein